MDEIPIEPTVDLQHDETAFEDHDIFDEEVVIAFEEAATVSEEDLAPAPAKEVHERRIENFSLSKPSTNTQEVAPH